jgi:hypothetical protein
MVVTTKGIFSANASGSTVSLDATEECAITKALQRAGLEIEPSAPDVIIGSTASVMEPSVFKSHAAESPGAETAQLMCANDDDGRNPHPIVDYYAGSDIMSAEQVAKKTSDKHGKPLCAECSSAEVRRRSKRS